jgi:DNA-binding NarL/FixJ family response regulator
MLPHERPGIRITTASHHCGNDHHPELHLEKTRHRRLLVREAGNRLYVVGTQGQTVASLDDGGAVLTERERGVLTASAIGLGIVEVAERLGQAPDAVRESIASVRAKLGALQARDGRTRRQVRPAQSAAVITPASRDRRP